VLSIRDWRLRQRTNGLQSILVPIPHSADDVCPTCRSWRHPRWSHCSNCLEAESELSHVCGQVIPISLYRKPSALRDALTSYKSTPQSAAHQHLQLLRSILRRYMLENRRNLKGHLGGYTVACQVPSSNPRFAAHPMRGVIGDGQVLGAPLEGLLERASGPLGHRRMSDSAFRTTKEVSQHRVLLVDDVFTTGASAQSAASALTLSGATVVGILVIARRVDPEFNQTAQDVWDRQADIPYSFRDALSWLLPGR